MKNYPAKVCTACGQTWQPADRYQSARGKSCSKECAKALISRAKKGKPALNNRRITITCPVCSTLFDLPPSHLARVKVATCSKKCNGFFRGQEWGAKGYLGSMSRTPDSYAAAAMKMERNPAWKGGVTFKRSKGNYIGPKYVRCPTEWKVMARSDGYIMEHRLVMAIWVGRPLLRTEVVNHINHNTRDNRRENLELYPSNGDHKRGEVGRFVPGVSNQRFLPAVVVQPGVDPARAATST